ncbi:MAG: NGG1p interacting factor NIF3, partial [Candidatus Omnitrophica bacterium]|nr:NGG1p interacting factor NIF3 [Candidatus Omnitrophota bacterium]
VGEVLLADRLRQKGKKLDMIITHHPEGRALANFYEVMHMQADILSKVGVPINVAEGLLSERIQEVARRVMPINHTRAVDAAKLLDIPFMTCHTPADNHVATFLQAEMDRKKPDTVGDVVKLLKGMPEYQEATRENSAPRIVRGNSERRAGKVFVEMTGGTEGAKEIFQKLSVAGVGTIVCMHLSEEHLKNVEKEQINVVIAGHISSDNLGLNLLLDELEKKEKFEIIPCSGFRRFSRRKQKL